jgi:3-hydroxyacyl-CoA dehydrogenase / 3-hydroxy-2-methylbutyryl-CoA dehydrogenase
MRIEQARAVVTGGASGLGAGTVSMVIEEGGRAAIFDLADSRGSELAEQLGDRCSFVAVDVAEPEQVEWAVSSAAETLGSINLLVNCAGISPAIRVLSRNGDLHPLDVFRRTLDVNLIGSFDLVRQCARHIAANDPSEEGERGLVVNTASIAALEGQVGQAAYAASKGGIAALTLPLARDLAVHGIRVMTIAPGIMDTGMLAGIDDQRRAALLDMHVFPKRLGAPEDFAALVRTFAETTLLNGEVVRLDAATRLA